MRKNSFQTLLLLLALALPSIGLAATAPTTPVLPPCPAEVLKYYPAGQMEQLLGQPVYATGVFSGSSSASAGMCVFHGSTTPYADVTGNMDSYVDRSAADLIFTNGFNGIQKSYPGASSISTGVQCDRYYSVKQDNGSVSIFAQKGTYFFLIAASSEAKLTVAALVGAAEYACGQVAGSPAQLSASPLNTGGPGIQPYAGSTSSTGNLSVYLMLGLLILAVIVLVLWLFMRHKKNSGGMPPAAPPAGPQEPLSGPPVS